MECPYCFHTIAPTGIFYYMGEQKGTKIASRSFQCPSCRDLIISKITSQTDNFFGLIDSGSGRNLNTAEKVAVFPKNDSYEEEIIYPKTSSVKKFKGVGDEILKDFNEARSVLIHSANASAALSRRCLQTILQKKENIKDRNLFLEIKKAIDTNIYGSSISRNLTLIRNVGNAGAHPIESQTTGEILEVTTEHASSLIVVIERILKHYEDDANIQEAENTFQNQ